jgi:outer membrane protein TolC
MKRVSGGRLVGAWLSLFAAFLLLDSPIISAEPLPLKRAVELALSHSTAAVSAELEQQRAFASYHEARNQYLPTVVVGAGLGASWGFPLSLEGAAPSIFNVNAQSALLNPALRDFVRAAKTEWQASSIQTRDQRNQVIQDTVLNYAELDKWETSLSRLQDEQAKARKMEQIVNQRIQEGVDSALMRDKAQLTTARLRLRLAQAEGAIDVLRNRLSHLTGLPASSIEAVSDSIPALPQSKGEENLVTKALQASESIQIAETHVEAASLRARGEHRALLPMVDFATQYAVLSKYNNYSQFYKSFERNNATVGVAIRFPFLNPSQHAHAEAADAEALKARKNADAARNQVSDEALRLERSVEQLAAAQQVASLEYQIALSSVESQQIRLDAGSATIHDLQDARDQANERYNVLQDSNFELERAQIALLRATGELANWVGISR